MYLPFLPRQGYGMFAGNAFEGACCFSSLSHKNIDRQLKLGFHSVLNSGTLHESDFLRRLNEQVNVTTQAIVIQSGSIEPYLRTLPQHVVRRAFDGVDLGGGQAHGVK